MKVDSVERIKKEIPEKDFLRETLISLSLEKDTPADVLTATFADIESSEGQYLLVKANTNCTYSCSVGYDRTVVYYENDTKKTKTVTDWQPFSGSNSSVEMVNVENADRQENLTLDYSISHCVAECKEESFEKLDEEMEVNHSALEFAKSRCVSKCFHRVSLPGDRHKDESYSGSTDIISITGFYMPKYELNYKYQDKIYTVNGFACGNSCMDKTFPTIANDVENQAKEQLKPLKIAGFVTAGVALLSSIIPVLSTISIIPWFGAIGILIAYFVKKKKIKNAAFNLLRQQKRGKLVDELKRLGLEALTAEEIARFDEKVK